MNVIKTRNSNLELYRIICMLMIVAHHYVVNSGLTDVDGPLSTNLDSVNTIYLRIFGAWGKVGINCFLMITGYYMCKSKITVRKLLKLLLQIYVYKILFFIIFVITGYQPISLFRIVRLLMPFWGLKTNFVTCFIVFYLTIPFYNILIQNLTKKQHELLLLIILGCFTILGSIPTFGVNIDYVFWFGVVYLLASYIRLYPNHLFFQKRFWKWMTYICFLLICISIYILNHYNKAYYFVIDSNKILAVLFALSSFLWFKNMDFPQSSFINYIGGLTFGVFLIHANSDAMRTWLWRDTVDCIGHYSLPLLELILYSGGVVILIFIVCCLIDCIRKEFIEKPFFKFYDRKMTYKVDNFISKLLN